MITRENFATLLRSTEITDRRSFIRAREAISGDYDHLLVTAMMWVEVEYRETDDRIRLLGLP
jgi:hypothetical protein